MKRTLRILIPIMFFTLVGAGMSSCGSSVQVGGTHVETTHLGKNKYFFSKKYQKKLKKRAKKHRRRKR